MVSTYDFGTKPGKHIGLNREDMYDLGFAAATANASNWSGTVSPLYYAATTDTGRETARSFFKEINKTPGTQTYSATQFRR